MDYQYLKDWDKDEGPNHHYAFFDWLKEDGKKIDFLHYIDGYKESIRAIFNSSKETSGTYPYAFPILFLIRHSLEIGMKHMIIMLYRFERIYFDDSINFKSLNKNVGKKFKKLIEKNHHLENIFKSLNHQIESFNKKSKIDIKQESANYNPSILLNNSFRQDHDVLICKKFFQRKDISKIDLFTLLEEFCKFFTMVDPEGTVFRYNVINKKLQPSLEKNYGINIEMVVCYYLQVMEIFDYLYYLRDKLEEFKNES